VSRSVRARRAFGWSLAAILLSTGCRVGYVAPTLPTPSPPTRPPPVAHSLQVALLPLVDGRTEAPSKDGLYAYRGRTYRGTNLDRLEPDAMAALTRAFAEHLLQARVFQRLVLVLEREQAADADLFLTGSLIRARGYVEAVDDGELAWLLGEVELRDLQLVDRSGQVRFRGETGWAFERQVPAGSEPDPYAVLSEALAVSVGRLSGVWLGADFEGFDVPVDVELAPGRTAFDQLAEVTPRGWSPLPVRTEQRPRGWGGEERCERTGFAEQQSLRFHRAIGPYTPLVEVWRCAADVRLAWDRTEVYPARLLGTDVQGRWIFASQVGRSSWRGAVDQLSRALALRPPPRRYVFEIPPADRDPAERVGEGVPRPSVPRP
jgi:hypothetical protein